MNDLKWVMQYASADPVRKKNADVAIPVIISPDRHGRLTVIDGLHRLAKAIDQGLMTLPGRYIEKNELNKIKVKS